MYFASLDAYAYKWCADTPEGIRTSDAVGIDPVYGITLKPCTFEQIVTLRQSQKGFTGPQKVRIDNPRQFEFFDGITGKPRIWYYEPAEGRYDLYDRPGRHPGTGEDLHPIDRKAIQELVRLQELEEAKRAENEFAAKRREAERTADAQKREHEALLERYINTAITKGSGRKIVAVLILPEGQDSFSTVERTLVTLLSKQGIEPVLSAFKPRFIKEGRARRLVAGNWNEATELDLSKRVDYLVSGLASATYIPSAQFDGLITANLQLELRCLNVVAQMVCGSQMVSQTGAGYTNGAALETAAVNAKPHLEAFVGTLQLN
jgi:hypothetical protein